MARSAPFYNCSLPPAEFLRYPSKVFAAHTLEALYAAWEQIVSDLLSHQPMAIGPLKSVRESANSLLSLYPWYHAPIMRLDMRRPPV